jgi:hypothetical protein
MRSLMIFLLLAVSNGFCQPVAQRSGGVALPGAEETVRAILSRPDGMYSSWDEKALAKFGDAAAVALTKVFGERDPSESEVRLCLVIIRASFWYPQGVVNESDRKPQTALFVLRRLGGLRLSPDLKEEIVETRKRILSTAGGPGS